MPIFKTRGKLVYFAHVPKCGGTAVETYIKQRFGALAFLDQTYFGLNDLEKWNRTSPQHISDESLSRLFPDGFFDDVFAVVRNPVDRLISEYHFLRDTLLLIPLVLSFSEWISSLKALDHARGWNDDNHLRPMNSIVPKEAVIFKLEEGLDQVVAYLDRLEGEAVSPRSVPVVLERNKAFPKVMPTRADIELIEDIYSEDFDRFGYPRHTGSLANLPDSNVQSASPYNLSQEAGEVAFQHGIKEFAVGNFDAAEQALRQAIDALVGDPRPRALFANSQLRRGEAGMALYHAMVVLRDTPEHPDALVALAGAALRLGDLPLVKKTVSKLELHPSLADFIILLKIALSVEEGQFETAIFDLSDFLEKAPADALASELFGISFQKFMGAETAPRFAEFIESLGLNLPQDPPQPKSQKEAVLPETVDIIVPVFNSLPDLMRCLGSIRDNSSIALRRIILVDDCSKKETAEWLNRYASDHHDVILVRNEKNLGFTRAVMAGVEISTAPFALFLNSDTIVTKGWLEGLLVAMAARPKAALVGPLSNDGYFQTIHPAGHQNGAAPISRLLGDVEFTAARVREVSKQLFPSMPFLSGFCLLLRRDAFDSVGGLDYVNFPFGYWEVQDLSLKLIDQGWIPLVADNVYVYHVGGSSIADTRKQALIQTGKLAMCSIHSAVRFYVAAALCAAEPEILRQKRAWSEFDAAEAEAWVEI